MTLHTTRVGRRVALAAAFLMLGCQRDGDALFDNGYLDAAISGGAATGATSALGGGGSSSSGGGNTGVGSQGGSSSDAGEPAGAEAGGGNDEGGSAGSLSGSSGGAGKAGSGGSAGAATAGSAGHGGNKPEPEPEPVTVTIDEFEDSYVMACAPYMMNGNLEAINVDGEELCEARALIRPLLDQIPAAAVVSKATLTLECVNTGDPVTLSYVEETWRESTLGWYERPDAGSEIGGLDCSELGPVTIDLTDAVSTWLQGEHPYGIYLTSEGSDGVDIASSETDDSDQRPRLSVTYVVPIK